MAARRGSITSAEMSPQAAAQRVRIVARSLGGVLRILLIVVGCAIALYLLWRVRTMIRLVGISLFLALAIFPVVDALERRLPMPRSIFILIIYLFMAVAVVLIGALVVPSLIKELGSLSRNAPKYARELRANAAFRHYDNRYHISAKLVRDARQLPHALGRLAGPLKQVTVSAFSLIGLGTAPGGRAFNGSRRAPGGEAQRAGARSSSALSARTRRAISSRVARTSASGRPFGSGSSQST